MLNLCFDLGPDFYPTELSFETFDEATNYVLSVEVTESMYACMTPVLTCAETLAEFKFDFQMGDWVKLV